MRRRFSHRALNPTPGHGTAGVGARARWSPSAAPRGTPSGEQSGSQPSSVGRGRGGPLPAEAPALFSLTRQRGWPSGIGGVRAVPARGTVAGNGSLSPSPQSSAPRRAAHPAGPRGSVPARLRSHGRAGTRVGPGRPPPRLRRRLPMLSLRPGRAAGGEGGAPRPVFRTTKCFSFLSLREVRGALPGCSRCRGQLGRERRGEASA